MRHLDLFSGIGGFALAARWMGWETVQFVEIDKFCQKVLAKNFPGVPIHDDIKTFDGTKWTNRVDLLTGGFPCQDLSVASSNGKQGFEGAKSGLYNDLIRCIRDIKPTNALLENVYGLVTQDNGQALETMLRDLEIEGYQAIPMVLYSSAIGANHHRKRFFAYATRQRNGVPSWEIQARRHEPKHGTWWDTEPSVCRVYDGLPEGLDKRRLRALGNAVEPQKILDIFKAISSTL